MLSFRIVSNVGYYQRKEFRLLIYKNGEKLNTIDFFNEHFGRSYFILKKFNLNMFFKDIIFNDVKGAEAFIKFLEKECSKIWW